MLRGAGKTFHAYEARLTKCHLYVVDYLHSTVLGVNMWNRRIEIALAWNEVREALSCLDDALRALLYAVWDWARHLR